MPAMLKADALFVAGGILSLSEILAAYLTAQGKDPPLWLIGLISTQTTLVLILAIKEQESKKPPQIQAEIRD